jgi:hypothetical protein
MRRFAILLDSSEAPDAAIDFSADLLASYGVKATWFIARQSAATERLARRSALFELIPGERQAETLARFPKAWRDETELERQVANWDLAPILARDEPLTVLAFLPLHVLLNTRDANARRALLDAAPALSELSAAQLAAHTQAGLGTRSLLLSLLAHVSGGPATVRLCDL